MALTKEQLADLEATSGENRAKGPRLETKNIKFDGITGEFRKMGDDGDQEPLSLPLDFVILKKRLFLETYQDDESRIFSTEYEFTSTIINLFVKEKGGKAKFLGSGTPPQLRAKYPTLRTIQVLYILHDGDISRLEVKGKSFTNFIEYQEKLGKENLRSFQVGTVVPSLSDGKKGVVKYKFMNFESRDLEEDEFEPVKTALEAVTKKLYEVDKYYAEKNAASAAIQVEEPQLEYPDTDVDPEDIPF